MAFALTRLAAPPLRILVRHQLNQPLLSALAVDFLQVQGALFGGLFRLVDKLRGLLGFRWLRSWFLLVV